MKKPIRIIVIVIFIMSLCTVAFSQTKKEVKQWSKYEKKVENILKTCAKRNLFSL